MNKRQLEHDCRLSAVVLLLSSGEMKHWKPGS